MLKLALRNLAAGKIRLVLTAFLIIVGVGFVSSSFILRDGLKDVFGNLAEEVVQGIDVGVSAFEPELNPIVEADLAVVESLDGVASARLEITGEDQENRIQPIKPDGTTITLQGPPQLAFGWTDDEVLSIIEGEAPDAPDEWVIDPSSQAEHGFVIGDEYDFVTPAGGRTGTLVGTYTFNGFIEGPTYMAMTSDTLREWLVYGDRYDALSIVADGSVAIPELISNVESALNQGGDRVFGQSQEELIAETTDEFNSVLDIIGGILLGFALLSLFVSAIIIIIIFVISIQQRTREIGLMRAVGATPAQVMKSVLAESFVIGLISSILGIGGGVLIAIGIRAALSAAGLGIPSFGLVIKPLTVILAFIVGIGVTMAAAVAPSIIASRVSPITAISGVSEKGEKTALRYVAGLVIAGIGVALMLLGLFGGADTVLGVLVPLGLGAAVTIIGILFLSPLVAGPLASVLGTPLQSLLKTPGRLAKDNAARNPRRTGTIASVLMVGLTAVAMVFVLGASFTAEFDRILNTSVQGDYLVTSNNEQADIPDEVVDLVTGNAAFGNVSSVKYADISLVDEPIVADAGPNPEEAFTSNGDPVGYWDGLGAFDYDEIDGLFNLSVVEGSLDDMTSQTIGIQDVVSEELGLGIGDSVTAYLIDGSTDDFEIVAIFEEAQIVFGTLVTLDRFSNFSTQRATDWVAAKRAEGVSIEEADAVFAEIGAEYPNLNFQSSAEFRQSFTDQISFVTRIITILLSLTILISLVGIMATVALSVFERIREIGLLRAVGSTRRQIFTIVVWEGAITCAIGAILGAMLGIGLGALIVTAIPGDFISAIAIPWASIIGMVLVMSIAGLVTAFLPAAWASSRNVLEAISA